MQVATFLVHLKICWFIRKLNHWTVSSVCHSFNLFKIWHSLVRLSLWTLKYLICDHSPLRTQSDFTINAQLNYLNIDTGTSKKSLESPCAVPWENVDHFKIYENPLHVSLEWKIQRCRLRPTMHEIYLNVTIMLSDSSSMNLSSNAFSGSKFFKNCNTSCLCWMKVDTCTSS